MESGCHCPRPAEGDREAGRRKRRILAYAVQGCCNHSWLVPDRQEEVWLPSHQIVASPQASRDTQSVDNLRPRDWARPKPTDKGAVDALDGTRESLLVFQPDVPVD